jgi:hypothetical protein
LNGGHWSLVREFTEIESGKRSDRPMLSEAIKACRAYGAKIVIAKLVVFHVTPISSWVWKRPGLILSRQTCRTPTG